MAKKKAKKEEAFSVDNFLSECAKDLKNADILSNIPDFKILNTSIPGLNRAFGPMSGLPLSRLVVVHGPNSAGKSALALLMAKDFQEQGHFVVYIDAEHTIEKKWPKVLGVDIDKMLIMRPDHFQDCSMELDAFFRKYFLLSKEEREKRWVCVIVDTLAKLVPQEEVVSKKKLPDGMSDTTLGKAQGYPLQAMLVKNWLNKLTPMIGKNNIAFICLQQERVKIDANKFEEQYQLPGGQALQFDNSMRIRVELKGNIKDSDTKERLGKEHRLTIMKSKIGVDNEVAYFYTSTGRGEDEIGYDYIRSLVKEAKIQGVIKNSGAKHTCKTVLPDEEWNGEKNLRSWLKENPEQMKKIVNELNKFWKKTDKVSCLIEDDVDKIDITKKAPELIDDKDKGVVSKNIFKKKG